MSVALMTQSALEHLTDSSFSKVPTTLTIRFAMQKCSGFTMWMHMTLLLASENPFADLSFCGFAGLESQSGEAGPSDGLTKLAMWMAEIVMGVLALSTPLSWSEVFTWHQYSTSGALNLFFKNPSLGILQKKGIGLHTMFFVDRDMGMRYLGGGIGHFDPVPPPDEAEPDSAGLNDDEEPSLRIIEGIEVHPGTISTGEDGEEVEEEEDSDDDDDPVGSESENGDDFLVEEDGFDI
ncbi:hypothetical protein FRC10_005295, partial [Ceratobasidium sp. 414]